MSRITPPSGNATVIEDLEDHEPYKVVLKTIEKELQPPYGKPEAPPELRLILDWELENEDTLRDWVGLRLGKAKSGGVSKLRQLLNATAGKPSDAEIAWFDTETLEFGYEADGPAHSKLYEGAEVVIRGTTVTKADGNPRFAISIYQAVKKATGKKLQKASEEPIGPGASSDEEIPF